VIKFQLLSLWLQRLTAQCQVALLWHLSQAQCPPRRAGKEGNATTQYMGQHLPTPAASVLTWHRPPPGPWLMHARESPVGAWNRARPCLQAQPQREMSGLSLHTWGTGARDTALCLCATSSDGNTKA